MTKPKVHLLLALVAIGTTIASSAQQPSEESRRIAREVVDKVVEDYEQKLLESEERKRQWYYDSAQENWLACLRRSVIALDDGVSTVSDVADVVKSDCQTEAGRMFAFSRDGVIPDARGIQDITKATAARLVLQLRSATRLKKPRPEKDPKTPVG